MVKTKVTTIIKAMVMTNVFTMDLHMVWTLVLMMVVAMVKARHVSQLFHPDGHQTGR